MTELAQLSLVCKEAQLVSSDDSIWKIHTELFKSHFNSQAGQPENDYKLFCKNLAVQAKQVAIQMEQAKIKDMFPVKKRGQQLEITAKVLVLGEKNSEKTRLIARYVGNQFSSSYSSTIGLDFQLKTVTYPENNTTIRTQLWDIAGQERFGNMTRVYYQNACCAIIVVNMDKADNTDSIVKWKEDLNSKLDITQHGGKIFVAVIGHYKNDQPTLMQNKDLIALAKANKVPEDLCFFSKITTGEGVDHAFKTITDKIVADYNLLKQAPQQEEKGTNISEKWFSFS